MVFSVYEVEQALNKLNKNKGAGPDNIPSYFVVLCASSLKYPLTLIFNQSLRSGVFPDRWKEACIILYLRLETGLTLRIIDR